MTGLRFCFVLLVVLVAGCSPGPSLHAVFEASDQQIRVERAETALSQLQEARVDNPDNAELLFAIACAQQATGTLSLAAGELGAAEAEFRKAIETFQRVDEAPGDEFDVSARFNAATVGILLNRAMTAEERYADRIENMETSIAALEGLVRDAPYLIEAPRNLTHARYQLCLLRQHPPGEEDKEEETPEEEDPPTPSITVDSASTQIPDARAEVQEDGTIMLHLPPAPEGTE